MKVYTHFNLDLDAAASLWFARKFIPGAREAEVVFVSASWDGAGIAEGDLALDISAGGRGIKGETHDDGRVGSCFAALVGSYADPTDLEVLRHLVTFVEAQDANPHAVQLVGNGAGKFGLEVLDAVSVNSVLRALQATHSRDDALVASRMAEVFSGMLKTGARVVGLSSRRATRNWSATAWSQSSATRRRSRRTRSSSSVECEPWSTSTAATSASSAKGL